MDRLFRDWRFALLWVVGISALAAAYFAQGGGHEQLLATPQPEAAATGLAPGGSQRHVVGPAAVAEGGEEQSNFGEPVMDTTGFEPSPAEPAEAAGPAAQEPNAPAPEGQ